MLKLFSPLRRAALAALLVGTAVAALAAGPTGPLTLIYPAPAGGGGDAYFRLLSKVMDQSGFRMVVVNVSGGGGSIGVEKMVNSKPDGTTVAGVWTGPVSIAPHTLGVRYKPADYIPVIQFSSTPYVLCVSPEFPANSGKELLDLAKKNPDKYSFGTDGPGGLGQLAATRVFLAFGVKQRDIPYKGAGETTLALMGRNIDIYVGSIPPILPFVKDGRAKCLIVTSARRADMLPGAASLTDLGIPNEETLLWRGVLAPKGTSAEHIEQLTTVFEQAAKSPESVKFLTDVGETLNIIKGPRLTEVLNKEYADFERVVKAAGMGKKE